MLTKKTFHTTILQKRFSPEELFWKQNKKQHLQMLGKKFDLKLTAQLLHLLPKVFPTFQPFKLPLPLRTCHVTTTPLPIWALSYHSPMAM